MPRSADDGALGLRMPPAFRSIKHRQQEQSVVTRSATVPGGLHVSRSSPALDGEVRSVDSPTLPGSNRASNPQSAATTRVDDEEEDQDEDEEEAARSSVAPTEEYLEDERASALRVRSSMELRPGAGQGAGGTPRDRYGFRKQTAFLSEQDYDRWWAGYEPHLMRRKRKWVRLMRESGLYGGGTNEEGEDQPVRFPPRSDKLRRYVRKGVPAEWRGNAWWWFARGPEKLAAHPGLYDKLCRQTTGLRNADTELIERDLQRTFPDNVYFRNSAEGSGPGAEETVLVRALRRVLTAFSVYMPTIGYCQSLNFLAGMLLLFVDEERAFWLLVIITQRYLPGVHEVSLEGVNVDQGVLMLCIRDTLPGLWPMLGANFDGQRYDNFLTKLPPITLCTASWFMSGFIGVLPTETLLRVWDCFFFEGSKVFFRVALTILKLSEHDVNHLHDQMEVFQAIQNLPKRLIDANHLLEQCFSRRSGFNHISQPEIARLREFVADRRRLLAQTANPTTNPENEPIDGLTDLEAFKRLKPTTKRRGLQLSKRMKSLKIKPSANSLAS
ncbi:hypothetical protein TRICI_004026 [Trichomonascus ciferrii]|uniref:Rab-GAP TBC domain-containing protein n=1 Tax=Trichomonascus ciferrii TaxID=44093 RepID=A0A642V3E5_9ASCO|nr:hypothetical protein TRICI_004026 [Trichomonascus ciferrii]